MRARRLLTSRSRMTFLSTRGSFGFAPTLRTLTLAAALGATATGCGSSGKHAGDNGATIGGGTGGTTAGGSDASVGEDVVTSGGSDVGLVTSGDAPGFVVDSGPGTSMPIPTDTGPCTGIACNVTACSGGGHTTISGTVYAPNGTLPLYNVIVYVPNQPLDPLPKGVSCDHCGTVQSGAPIATALSDSSGHFQLVDVPVGDDIPVVVQLGKWRRQITVPHVAACADTPITTKGEPRLPKNQSEGNMPHVAVTTGGCDKLSCMLPKVGIDPTEFGAPGSGKAVEFYNGWDGSTKALAVGPSSVDAETLWNDVSTLSQYDVAIFSCECEEASTTDKTGGSTGTTKSATSFAAVASYLNAGGRIFTTDFQYDWYRDSPDKGLAAIGNITGNAPPNLLASLTVSTSFPKGKAMADWLKVVEPSAAYGQVTADFVFNNFQNANTSTVQTWATQKFLGVVKPGFMSVNTPVGVSADAQCGKALHLDAHINQFDQVDATYPAGCKTAINDGELAFAFLFFDLSACIQNESVPPAPPKPNPMPH